MSENKTIDEYESSEGSISPKQKEEKDINELLDEVSISDVDVDSEYDSEDEDSDEDEEKIIGFHKEDKDAEDEEYGEDEEEDDEEEEDYDENYLKKFDEQIKKNVISQYHPELNQHNYQEIEALTTVIRNAQGTIIDPLHKTLPFLTKYEKARILGDRARQINSGAKCFVEVEPFVMDGYLIALKELEEKKIPFIIKRPLPNGGVEYWKLKDLEILV